MRRIGTVLPLRERPKLSCKLRRTNHLKQHRRLLQRFVAAAFECTYRLLEVSLLKKPGSSRAIQS